MSARKILSSRALKSKYQKMMKELQEVKIRTFDSPDSLSLLKMPTASSDVARNRNIGEDISRIQNMAALRNLAYLVDSQYHLAQSVFTINRHLKSDFWIHADYNDPNEYDVYFNPRVTRFLTQPRPYKEHCNSFPFMECFVDRSLAIQVEYEKQQEKSGFLSSKTVAEKLEGFKAVVFQHCLDHTSGLTFFDPKTGQGRLRMTSFGDHYQKTQFLIKEYNTRIKMALAKEQQSTPEFAKAQQDYEARIAKAFRQETMEYEIYVNKMMGK